MAAAAVQSRFVNINSSSGFFVDSLNWQFQPFLAPLLGYSNAMLEVASESDDLHLDSKATTETTSEIDDSRRYIEESTVRIMDRLASSSSSGSSSSKASSHNWTRSSSTGSHTSSDEEIAGGGVIPRSSSEIRRVFERFDENNDGLICAKDLHRFMRRLGFEMSEEDAVSMLQCVDHNDDGRVDFDEFYSLYKSLSDSERKAETENDEADDEDDTLREAFKVFDKNGDGVITAAELQTVLRDMGFPEGKSLRTCERMIQRVDSTGNGKVDIREFKTMMCSKCFQM